MRRKLISICIIVVLVLGSSMSFAYSVLHQGIENPPMYFTCYSGFEEATNQAIHNACLEINGAGAGALMYRTTYTHNNIRYPLLNGKNEITKGNRGTGELDYIAQISSRKNILFKVYEADIDINVDKPISTVASSETYDIQNFITHELLHAAGADDLYNDEDSEKTAYGYTFKGERKKRSLHQDDINCIIHIYN